jgi:hypothetical protein
MLGREMNKSMLDEYADECQQTETHWRNSWNYYRLPRAPDWIGHNEIEVSPSHNVGKTFILVLATVSTLIPLFPLRF